jgi:glycosyltransferase involved in cell wall biosynthesis
VIGSANPNVDFMPGDRLHRLAGVPYVMDHRDAWHLDVYSGRRVGSRNGRSSRIERRLIARTAEAWFVNQAILDWHAAEHPGRARDFHVVANGYDPGFLDPARPRRADPEAGLVFGYLGTIYGPIPLRETLEAWRLARSTSPLIARSRLVFRGRLGHFAEPDAEAAALLEEFRGDGVSYEGPVSKTQIATAYQGFDALLLIISKSRYVTSGKVFEYAATGLPIGAIHDPETAATGVLADHPARFAVAEVTIPEIARVLIAVGERAATMSPEDIERIQQWARHLSRDEQLLPRIRALRELVDGGPR